MIDLLNKIKEIEAALDVGCQHCALALALTLPDICGKVLKSETKRRSKDQYIKWFDKYVVPIYAPLGKIYKSFVTGKTCYALRCSFLHAGNFDPEKENIFFNIHSRIKSEKQGYHDLKKEVNGETIIDIDAVGLCNAICEAAKSFYNDTENKDLFRDKYIKDID